jgi:predicted amidohydrolase YtcJ
MPPAPPLLLHNARIWTGVAATPWADAALVRDGRFVFVGREADVNAPAAAEVLDCSGRLVVPGFTDAHAHLLGTGAAMRSVDLKRTKSVEEAVTLVAERVRDTPRGAWVYGRGWDQNWWPGARFPHRRDLDAIAPDNPVVLGHTSGHCSWVNSAALRAAGITTETQTPVGGAIDRDPDGEPNGILRDAAARLVTDVTPPPTRLERIAALEDAIGHAHKLGITCVHAMNVGRGELQALYGLHDSDALRLRVRPFLSAARIDEWFERNIVTGDGDAMLRIGGVKFFADGALGSLTAWMCEPYEGSSDSGFPLQPPEELERDVRRCLEHGLAPAVHAIGDRANGVVLDIFGRLRDVAPALPRRIEHAQVLTAEDVPRFGALGVAASVQPIHATEDMEQADRDWGARGRYAYVFRSLAQHGALLAFGSDSPVQTMDPLVGIHAAVTRRNAGGAPPDGWYADERISIAAAVAAYTSGPARAVGEDDAGRIEAGCHADFAVLSHDVFAERDPMRILDARVDVTAVAGEVVYRREA